MAAESATLQEGALSLPARWSSPPPAPPLTAGALHVWRAQLDTLGDEYDKPLGAGERKRARRFADERRARRWRRAHGLLRVLLGRYLGEDASALRFASGPHGKPELVGARMSFNLSHSGDLALFAFCAAGAVGVDVEVARRPMDELALAARALGDEPARRLASLAPRDRAREFRRLWTRHEAALKCAGVGIAGGSALASAPPPWIADLPPVSFEAAAAVAAQRAPLSLSCWTVTG